MKITSVNNFNFCKRVNSSNVAATRVKTDKDPENPISKPMEQLELLKGTILAGFGLGARMIFEAFDENPDAIDNTLKMGQKIAKKKGANIKNSSAKAALEVASAGAIIIGAVSIIAGIYAICNAPKAMYQGKINAHKKSKDMDVYLAANKVEKDLYKQVDKKAKEASTKEEQEHVKQQYLLLRAAKNQIPEFAKI